MATTSLSLGPHWEEFIRSEVDSGRFGSASEVVRAALRELEDRNCKLEALQAHLREGLEQADQGEFAVNPSVESVVSGAIDRARTKK